MGFKLTTIAFHTTCLEEENVGLPRWKQTSTRV